VDDAAETASLAYDGLGRQTRGVDADWQPTQTHYDSVDRVVRAADASGYWRDYGYDANGNLVEEKLVDGHQIVDRATRDHDFSDRPERAWDSAGALTAAQYDAAGNLIRLTDADGYVVQIEYDAMNRPVAILDKEGNASVTQYDLNGRVKTIIDANGISSRREYHGPERNGRLKQVIDPAGRTVSYDWDAHGNAVSVTDNLGRVSLTDYDELDRPVRQVGPAYTDPTHGPIRPVTRYTYDSLGHLTRIDAGRTDTSGTNPAADVLTPQATYVHDDFGRRIRATDPLGKVTTYRYDLHNNLIETTDAKNQKIAQTWAPGHRLKKPHSHRTPRLP
jgi:YD repeat-containing protein